MTDSPKNYWRSEREREPDADFVEEAAREFPEPLDPPFALGGLAKADMSRRSFLKLAGFSVAAAGLNACHRGPVKHALPWLDKPADVVAGRASWYATTCAGCTAGCGTLAKVRDGRPIKLEGNPDHPLSRGGLCAVGQAMVLGLYDSRRLAGPVLQGLPSTWADVDHHVRARLEDVRAAGGAVRLLTGTMTSPSTRAAIQAFLAAHPGARHVEWDPLSCSSVAEAYRRLRGTAVLPHYRFDRAEAIVSFDADFLGTWISPVEFTAGWKAGRAPAAPEPGKLPHMSWHAQLEARLSLTGTKADRRLRLAPQDAPAVLGHLVQALARKAGRKPTSGDLPALPIAESALAELADRLWKARGRALVVCGLHDVAAQVLAAEANGLLGAEGSTVVLDRPSHQRLGNDAALQELLAELRDGRVGALFVHGVNPVYALPDGESLAPALKALTLGVSFADRVDETAEHLQAVCPTPHFLESWDDAEPVAGVLSLTQPCIRPLGDTRSLRRSLAAWAGGVPESSEPPLDLDLLKAFWQEAWNARRETGAPASFEDGWNRAVHDGWMAIKPATAPRGKPEAGAVTAALAALVAGTDAGAEGTLDVLLYPKLAVLDGRHAENPWLQELADPISKVAWDNYAALAPETAHRLGLEQGDVVELEPANGDRHLFRGEDAPKKEPVPVVLPIHVQPGQHEGVVAVALGYGRKGTERFERVGPEWLEGGPQVGPNGRVGARAEGLATWSADGLLRPWGTRVTLRKTGGKRPLACSQDHHSLLVPAKLSGGSHEPRPIVQETTLPAYAADPHAGAPHVGGHDPNAQGALGIVSPVNRSLWPEDHPKEGRRWGMVIDLNACTGCSGCVLACQAENNIPVVGRDEVLRKREMHWIRVDRYFAGQGDALDTVHQPMTCHHCDHAPCETVCPVLATVHSAEGLNQQVYNRCVGTRYCANNCPFKVRRFNWFNYPHEDRLANMALNPDVTIRSRGVMEKCSFCVQRIQEAKAEAKAEGLDLADGDATPACQQSCPAGAIVFGDLNDPDSRVARTAADPRHYHVLAELKLRPGLGYLRVVRNRDGAAEGGHHGG